VVSAGLQAPFRQRGDQIDLTCGERTPQDPHLCPVCKRTSRKRVLQNELHDHFSADLINRGVALKQDFRDAFPGETDDDLSAIRKKFLGKAFERRQELLLRHLLQNGCQLLWITQASLRDLIELPLDEPGVSLRNLYVFMWCRVQSDSGQDDLAFTTVEGTPLDPGGLSSYLRKVAATRRNAEFNGFICRSLLAVRKGGLPN